MQDVERLLVMKGTDPAVRKKAALCFLRFFRENPGNYVHSELAEKMVSPGESLECCLICRSRRGPTVVRRLIGAEFVVAVYVGCC